MIVQDFHFDLIILGFNRICLGFNRICLSFGMASQTNHLSSLNPCSTPTAMWKTVQARMPSSEHMYIFQAQVTSTYGSLLSTKSFSCLLVMQFSFPQHSLSSQLCKHHPFVLSYGLTAKLFSLTAFCRYLSSPPFFETVSQRSQCFLMSWRGLFRGMELSTSHHPLRTPYSTATHYETMKQMTLPRPIPSYQLKETKQSENPIQQIISSPF